MSELSDLFDSIEEAKEKIASLLQIQHDWRMVGDYTNVYWAIVKNALYYSYEPFDLESVKEHGPQYYSGILEHMSVTTDYTVVEIILCCGDREVVVLDNTRRASDEIGKILNDF